FVGNDTMGTLLAWRGWSMHDRVSVFDEVLPLPDLWSLSEVFVLQRDGTTPFRDDLDDRLGWSARARLERDRWSAQYTRLDNRGDRNRYGDEYSWETDFHLAGVLVRPSDRWTLAAEYLGGFTAMGRFVEIEADFGSAYVLASYEAERWRASVRRDWMRVWEVDGDPRAENNAEEAWGWTGALLWSLTDRLRVGIELTSVNAARPSAAESGAGLDVGGRVATVDLKWSWGRTTSW
ncbi:MAG TPA: hypothetical protein VMS56_04315, partial [Thermoanaerobaculia bacterium]|nr:hypothetical protein [Thermoanaerobaculia bacterium]